MSCSCHSHDPSTVPGSGSISRRAVLAGSLAAGFAPLVLPGLAGAVGGEGAEGLEGIDGGRDFGFLPPRPASEVHDRKIMFPVLPDAALGRATWSDTYLAPRSSGRKHEGQDLMGNKLLKLLACVDGTIIELRHQAGGNSLYLKGDDGWYYCYLHINNDDPGTDNAANQFRYAFAPGMATGKRVLKGEHIAFLGDSGNAEATGSHCHFEIRMPNAKWYNAAAVNAKYSLNAATPAKIRSAVPDTAFAPQANAAQFALVHAVDFLGTPPANPWFDNAVNRLESGTVALDPFIEGLLTERDANYVTHPLIRLYLAFFPRIPDRAGLDYWVRRVRSGTPLDAVASQFAGGTEFESRYGTLSNADYVKRVYRNVFGREVDPSGLDYWTRRLNGGAKRGAVMRQWCESDEFRQKVKAQVRVTHVYTAMLQRSPDPSGYAYWSGKDAASAVGLQQLIKSLRTSGEYQRRF